MTTPDSRQSISPQVGQASIGKAAPDSPQRLVARIPLRTKLTIAFLAVTLIPLALLAYLNDRTTRQALIDAANEKLKAAAEQTRDSIDSFIQTNLSTIQTEARLPELIDYLNLPSDQRHNSSQEIRALNILHTLSSKSQNISSYALLDRRGLDVLDTYAADIDLNKFTGDYFQKPLETQQPYASPLRFSATTGELVVYFSTPVENAGEIVGILAVRYNAQTLQQLVLQKTDLVGKGSFAVLLDEDHIRLADGGQQEMAFKAVIPLTSDRLAELKADGRLPDLLPEELATNLPDFEQGLKQLTDEQPYFAAELHSVGEGLKQSAVAKTASQPWLVVFAQPQGVFLAPVAEQTNATVVGVLMIAVVVTFAAVGLAQLLTGPIIHLTTVARLVAAGDLTIQAHVRSRDETGVLAVAFNSMTQQLRSLISGLEERVAERTAQLTQRSQELEKINQELAVTTEQAQRRAAQLAASAQVARAVGQVRDLDELLLQVTSLISNAFGFYHVGIFINDEDGRYAVLHAANSEGGQRMLARQHKLEIGRQGIVGYVTKTGQPRIALDVGTDAIHFDNPDLPDTRSELALPLRMGGQVFGALDVQSAQEAAVSREDIATLETLADQIAIAIENARLFAQSQAALREAEEVNRRYLHEQWERLLPTLPVTSHEYCASGVPRLGEASLPEIQQAIQKGYAVITQGTDALTARSAVAIPVKLRDQVVGVIDLQETESERKWTDDDLAILQAVADQAALALENVRLIDETERLAQREKAVADAADKIHRSTDLETVLRNAVTELNRITGWRGVSVQLGFGPTTAAGNGQATGTEGDE